MRNMNMRLLLPILLFACSCKSGPGHTENKATVSQPIAPFPFNKDTLIVHYIKYSTDELITALRNNNTNLQWLPDRIERTDTALYQAYQLGHDEQDSGGANKRFVTDKWLYIDSAKNKLYEYDLPNDSLIEWKTTTK